MRARALGLASLVLVAGCQGQGSDNLDDAAEAPVAGPTYAASTAVGAQVAEQGLLHSASCAAEETTVFTCRLAGGKRVSVCGAGQGSAHYRFGEETTELALAGGAYANVMYSGGGENQIAFTNGTTRYIVFSRIVRTSFGEEGNAPAISDGVVIEQGGRFLDIKLCEDPDLRPVDVNAANAIWNEERELFTEETERADPSGNE